MGTSSPVSPGRRPAFRRAFVVGLSCVAVLASAQAAQAQAPPTLTGETLGTTQGVFSGPTPCIGIGGQFGPVCLTNPSGTIEGNIECDPGVDITGGSGTATLTFTGIATGPYPGTFTETIKITAGERDPNSPGGVINRFVTEFDATFRIDSPAGVVEGRKFLNPERVAGLRQDAACSSLGPNREAFEAIIQDARYEVTIDGSFADRGLTALRIEAVEPSQSGGDITGFFAEAFLSDLTQTEPIRPTTVEQCTKGGALTFGIFKNQGDCVAFVQTQGKNEPGQNQPK